LIYIYLVTHRHKWILLWKWYWQFSNYYNNNKWSRC